MLEEINYEELYLLKGIVEYFNRPDLDHGLHDEITYWFAQANLFLNRTLEELDELTLQDVLDIRNIIIELGDIADFLVSLL